MSNVCHICRSIDFEALFFNDYCQYARFLPLVTDLEEDDFTYGDDESYIVARDREGYLEDVTLDLEGEQEALSVFLDSAGYSSDRQPATIKRFIEDRILTQLPHNLFVRRLGTLAEVRHRSLDCELCAILLDTRLWRLPSDCDTAQASGDGRDPEQVQPDWMLYIVPIWPAWKMMWRRRSGPCNEFYILPCPQNSPAKPLEVIDDGFFSYNNARDLRTLCVFDHDRSVWQSVPSLIDWANVKAWMPDFKAKRKRSSSLSQPRSSSFMVMDICQNQIVTVSTLDGLCYAALSYVWGSAKTSEAWCQAVQTIHDQKTTSPVKYDPNSLPLTLQGAVIVCKALQIPYMWVDSLCIRQNAAHEKAEAIADMGHIYADCYICVVAAAQADVHVALPGVNSQRPSQYIHDIGSAGLTLGISPIRPTDGVEKSTWNTRGWTFQEAMLPESSLVILKDQVIFQSGRSLRCEYVDFDVGNAYETSSEDYEREPLTTLSLYGDTANPGGGVTNYFSIYKDMVGLYTQRKLTYQSDAENAFSGLLTTLAAQFQIDFRYGLPLNKPPFAQALNWYRNGNVKSLRQRRHPSKPGQVLFPSHTWLAMEGPVAYNAFPTDESLDVIEALRTGPNLSSAYPAIGFENIFATENHPDENGLIILQGAFPIKAMLYAVKHQLPSVRHNDRVYIDSMFKRGTLLDDDQTLPAGQLYCMPVAFKKPKSDGYRRPSSTNTTETVTESLGRVAMALMVQVFRYPYASTMTWPCPDPARITASNVDLGQQQPRQNNLLVSHKLTRQERKDHVYVVRRVGIIPYAYFSVDIESSAGDGMNDVAFDEEMCIIMA